MNYHFFLQRTLLVITLVIFILSAQSQITGSAVSGFVVEDSSNAVENATISIRNTTTGFTAYTASNKKGYFILSDVPVGSYDIQISSVGFNTVTLRDNVLNLGDRLVLHKITLSKTVNELNAVTVKSNSFTNSVDRLGTATAVSSRAIQKIPLISRNYTDLVSLSPWQTALHCKVQKQVAPVICWMVLATEELRLAA
jgi:hypothetical protein